MTDDLAPTKRPHEDDHDAEHLPVKRPRYGYNDAITVLVGPDEHRFVVHAEVICAKSMFFKAACTNGWKEGKEKIVRLPEAEHETFRRYVDWVYGNVIAAEQSSSGEESLLELLKMYILGEYLDDLHLRNQIMRALNNITATKNKNPGVKSINLIWENTVPSSLLRKWMIEITLFLAPGSFGKSVTEYPADFVQQVALRLMHKLSESPLGEWPATTDYLEKEEHHA